TAVGFRGTTVVAFSREPAKLLLLALGVAAVEIPLQQASVQSTGHSIFHQATRNAIACASCHPEAGEDGHVWNLPEGARRTPSLRGGLTGSAPFHWSGDQADISSLMSD